MSMRALMALIPAFPALAAAQEIDGAVQDKLSSMVADFKALANAPVIVKAVEDQNTNPSAEVKAMTQEKWKGLSQLDPFVRSLVKNEVGRLLKEKKGDVITEAFVSSADGTKVGLLSKTSSWSHKGKAKHDDPMAGKTWQGPVELDDSTGVKQVQVAVPVVKGGNPIGSLVVGINLSKLK